jgi:hypothetical protein
MSCSVAHTLPTLLPASAGKLGLVTSIFGLNASLDGNLTLNLGAVASLGALPTFTPSGNLDSSVMIGLGYKNQTVTGRLVFMDEGTCMP